MLKQGEVYENPVTGERAVVRVGTDQTSGERLVVDLFVSPGGRVAAEHYHPHLREQFTIVSGRVGVSINGRHSIAQPGQSFEVAEGVVHDWWNAGDDEAHVIVEVQPAARFEAMIRNAFGLAQDGKTDNKGMPGLLQLSVFAREFDDVIRFTRPPRIVQRTLFAALTPLARLAGYRGCYDDYLTRPPKQIVAPE
jgi:quercetin dioxygenase-like cupin family protein